MTDENPTVLIVDDDPLMLRGTKRALERRGWDVRTSTVPTWHMDVDVILTDWEPHGAKVLFDATMCLRPIVVFTGGDLAAVPDGVAKLQKPVMTATLDAALRAVMGGGSL